MRRHTFAQHFAHASASALFAALFLLLPCHARAQSYYGSESACAVSHWPEFAPEGEEFSIRMPTRPETAVRRIAAGRGRPAMIAKTFAAMGPNTSSEYGDQSVRYFVTAMKLPATAGPRVAVASREEVHKLMSTLAQRFDAELPVGIELAEPRDALVGGLLGREYVVRRDEDSTNVGRIRFFATQRAVYLVGYVSFSYCGIDFLDSFKLKDASLIVR